MSWQERIIVNPKVLAIIKGTRVSVQLILELLAERWTHEQILSSYPQLTQEHLGCVATRRRADQARESTLVAGLSHEPILGERECDYGSGRCEVHALRFDSVH